MRAAIMRATLANLVLWGGLLGGTLSCVPGKALTDPTGGGPGGGFHPPGPTATVITLAPTSLKGVVGDVAQVTATLKDQSGNAMTGPSVSWASSDTKVATVSTSGKVSLVKRGSATITASASGITASLGATVDTAPSAPVASIGISPSSITGVPGNTTQETASLKDSAGNTLIGPLVSWSSSNTSVATVSGSGLVTLVEHGTATITGSAQSVSASVKATVNQAPVASVQVTPTSASLPVGQTVGLTATDYDADGNVVTGVSVTWSSSNTGVASVSGGGLVRAISAGTADITASSGGHSAAATVQVTAVQGQVASVQVTPSSASLRVGQTVSLTATDYDASGNVVTGVGVTWTSSNTGVASVSGGGVVRAISAGTADITASSGGHSAAATVQVTATQRQVASVQVTPSSASLTVGQTVGLTATDYDANGTVVTGVGVSWTSSNTGVASVSGSGLVRAVAAGTAIITAASGGQAGTATVGVSGGGGGGGGTHEPGGMSAQITTGQMSSIPSVISVFSPSSPNAQGECSCNLGPVPGHTGLRVQYDPSLSGGYSPVRFGAPISNVGNGWYYQRQMIRFSPGFVGPPGTGVKINEPRAINTTSVSGQGTNHIVMVWAAGGDPSSLSVMEGIQGPYSHYANLTANVASGVLTDGNWHQWEVLFGPESSAGAGDGLYQAWVDGTLVAQYTNVNWRAAGTPQGINYWLVDPTWGGAPASLHPPSEYWDFDDLYVSTK